MMRLRLLTKKSVKHMRGAASGVIGLLLLVVVSAWADVTATRTPRHLFDLTSAAGSPLSLPTDVAVGEDGRIYVVDGGNQRIAVFDRRGGALFVIGQRGAGRGEFKDPVGIGTGPDGQVYVADKGNRRIQVFAADGKFLRAFNVASGGRAVPPIDVETDASGKTVYVTGNTNHKLMVYSPDGRLLRQWGGQGVNPGEFRYPASVTVGADGRVYVVDVFNTRVQVFDKNGRASAIGEWGVLPGQLFRPKGVATDKRGRVYISDSYLDVIQVFDDAGQFLYVLGSAGVPYRFEAAGGIVIDADNRLYVAEVLKNKISVFELKE